MSEPRPSTKDRTKVCRCGAKEEDGAIFYPSSPKLCAPCHTESRQRASRSASERVKRSRQKPDNIPNIPVVPPPAIPSIPSFNPPTDHVAKDEYAPTVSNHLVAPNPVEESSDESFSKIRCSECGRMFPPWKSGRHFQTKCKGCVTGKRVATSRERGTSSRKGIVMTPRGSQDRTFDLIAVLKRRLPNCIVLDFSRHKWAIPLLQRDIPDEEFANHVRKSLCKALIVQGGLFDPEIIELLVE